MSQPFPSPAPSANAQPKALRILCVDDNVMLRSSLARLLKFEGHSVRDAGNGREAWEQIARDLSSIDVIITDHDMPQMNGIAFVERVRRANFQGKIIVHSAAVNAGDLDCYRQSGVDAFVEKGTGPDELLTSLTASERS